MPVDERQRSRGHGHVDEAQFARLRTSAAQRLAAFAGADGSVSLPAPALIATAILG